MAQSATRGARRWFIPAALFCLALGGAAGCAALPEPVPPHRAFAGAEAGGGVAVSTETRAFRWSGEVRRPLRVWVERRPDLEGWTPHHAELARKAVSDWTQWGVPSVVIATGKPQKADIRVRWTKGLPKAHPGVTLLQPNRRGELVGADVWIDVAIPGREGATAAEVLYGVIAHEMGHAFGLPHAPDRAEIMHAVLYTLRVSSADLATLRDLTVGAAAGRTAAK